MKNNKYLVLIVLFTSTAFLFNGCTSDRTFIPPNKVEVSNTNPVQETQKTIFKIGETATDEQQQITLNNVRFLTKIDEKNNQYSIAEAPATKEYVILDITIKNALSDKTQNVSSLLLMELSDQDGYNYTSDFTALTALDKSFKDGEILPGAQKRGEIAFLVPSDVKELNFTYKFDLFAGTSATFKIK